MPEITCLPDGLTLDVREGETILDATLRAGLPHAHACGGQAKCSTCRVQILDGLDHCTAPTEAERLLAGPLGLPPDVRLACQTRLQGNATCRRLVQDEADLEVASQLRKLRIGPCGESKAVAVLFCDIRGFTSLAQSLSPYDLMFALNRHFRLLGEIIEANGGYVDNFIGDAIMALFGVDGDQWAPFRSVKAAVEMLDASDRAKSHMEAVYGKAFDIGIGVHWGEAVVGALGSSNRERLTAIGDTVNVASRIEAANKDAGTRLLISAELHELVKDDVIMQDFVRVKLRGTSERMSLYEISGIQPSALARDQGLQDHDPLMRRHAGKRWTAVLDAQDLPSPGRRIVELEAFDLLLIRTASALYAVNNACPHLRLPLKDAETTDAGVIVCKWHQSCFDLVTGEIKAWCPGLDPDGTSKQIKVWGNIGKNRATLSVFPSRIEDGKVWVALG